ncbi:hypothetical protein [Aeromonas molluscorum]|jgi:hypothetical protein|uniref:Uncharacterized protein n=1 Tax=Aeromonas molluscorum 848 TaxID=1268236 RepID=R1GYH7_9GAMM|nr:hypothetical protein [Aeromonas molluscorum]EOD56495.1 hypothetical protein G113_03309 [Aeromonas molluscorum 848]
MWLFLWRASLLYVFPLLMWGYCRFKEIEFDELDSGVNNHKWVVLAAYLLYVVVWILINRYLLLFLRQRSRR